MNISHFKNRPVAERRKLVRLTVDRMLKAYRLNDIRALAAVLKCTHGTIKNWRSSGHLPLDHISRCHFDTGASLDWLINGTGPVAVFNPQRVGQLTSHLNQELTAAVRFNSIKAKHHDSIDLLASELSRSLLEWMKVDMVEDKALPLEFNNDKQVSND